MQDNTIKRATRSLIAWMVICSLVAISPAAWAVIVGSLPFTLTNGTTADATQVMANYQKIIDDVNANAAAAGANSDITALLGLTTPITPSGGGSSLFYGGTSTGSANAQAVATLVPNSFSLVSGYTATFTAGFTNTGATTLALNGTTAKNVFKRTTAGAVALVGSEIISGGKYVVSYDGTQYQLVTPTDASFGARTDLASNTTTDLGTVATHFINITGTTTITGFGSTAVIGYPLYKLRFNAALTLTHNASSLIIPGAANIPVQAGDTAWVSYLGSGNWSVIDYQRSDLYPDTGQLARINVYVAGSTWTKAATERSVLFFCTGGGGAGGGADNTGANEHSGGGGGGAGGWAQRYITAPASSYTITIGAAGTGASGTVGGNGGNTTVGAVLTCNGGTGGDQQTNVGTTQSAQGGAGGTATTGDLNVTGERGGGYVGSADSGGTYWAIGGAGGSNHLGAGGTSGAIGPDGNATIQAGQSCGGGGAGSAAVEAGGVAEAGANGGVGCVIAYTYY